MKGFLLLTLTAASCANDQQEKQPPFSTVDSNVISVGDSTPAILHIDTVAGSDTAFTVAMDSVAPTITAKDTIR